LRSAHTGMDIAIGGIKWFDRINKKFFINGYLTTNIASVIFKKGRKGLEALVIKFFEDLLGILSV